MNRSKIIQMVIVLAAIVVIASSISRFVSRDSLSLSEYMQQNPGQSPSGPPLSQENSPVQSTAPPEEGSPVQSAVPHSPEESALTGAALNGLSQAQERTTLEEGFYYEPISHRLRRYMTGLSLSGEEDPEEIEDLCYVHILHYDFGGNPVEGELICSRLIAQDLLEIFHELYLNEYRIEKVLLAEEYSGDMAAAIEDNNTFCFGGRTQEDSHSTRHSHSRRSEERRVGTGGGYQPPVQSLCVLWRRRRPGSIPIVRGPFRRGPSGEPRPGLRGPPAGLSL